MAMVNYVKHRHTDGHGQLNKPVVTSESYWTNNFILCYKI